MKELILKVRNSEFLTLNELLRVKVSVVMIFLLMFGLLTIPVSFFEDFRLSIRIIVPATFVSLFAFTFLMLMMQKSRIAMHFSIYTFLGLTVYYVDGSGQLYGYFLLFITLTVIIFYQDITTYILYGGVLTVYGVFFIQTNDDFVSGLPENLAHISPIIYQTILIGFFLTYLFQFILTDSINENLNEEFLKTEKANNLYQDYVNRYVRDLEDREGINQLYDQDSFQRTVKDVSRELYGANIENKNDIDEIVDYYFFLHKQDVTRILSNKNASNQALKYARQFEKYLMNRNSYINDLFNTFHLNNRSGLSVNMHRYDQSLERLFSNKTNRILSIAVIYLILHNQVTRLDRWGRLSKIIEHIEIKKLFQTKEYREYMSFEDVNFFMTNENFFKENL